MWLLIARIGLLKFEICDSELFTHRASRKDMARNTISHTAKCRPIPRPVFFVMLLVVVSASSRSGPSTPHSSHGVQHHVDTSLDDLYSDSKNEDAVTKVTKNDTRQSSAGHVIMRTVPGNLILSTDLKALSKTSVLRGSQNNKGNHTKKSVSDKGSILNHKHQTKASVNPVQAQGSEGHIQAHLSAIQAAAAEAVAEVAGARAAAAAAAVVIAAAVAEARGVAIVEASHNFVKPNVTNVTVRCIPRTSIWLYV